MTKMRELAFSFKRAYRDYLNELLSVLESRGFVDLRPSFLEILIKVSQRPGSSIREIGESCHLKKQTMTGHVKELTERGYLEKRRSSDDKREFLLFLTSYGEKFRVVLFESLDETDQQYEDKFGNVEMERMGHLINRLLDL